MKADAQPSASAENDALRWAVDFFHKCTGLLKRNASKRDFDKVVVSHLVSLHDSPRSGFDDELTRYIEATREEPNATTILCKFAATLMERGDQLPSQLQKFIVEFLRPLKQLFQEF